MTPPSQQCRECGDWFPKDANSFKLKKDGTLDTRCLACRQRINAGKRRKKKAQYLKDVEVGAVGNFLKVAQTGGQNIPHSAEVLECHHVAGADSYVVSVVARSLEDLERWLSSVNGYGETRTSIVFSTPIPRRGLVAPGASRPSGPAQ